MSQADRIQAVIWDLGGVIVRTHDRSGRSRWEQRLGLEPRELEKLVFRSDVAGQAYVGNAGIKDVWRTLGDQLQVPKNELSTMESDFWSGDRVDYELVDYIRKLRPVRKTALLSNAWLDVRESITDHWMIADAFDHITISAEVGMAKPDPRIFTLTLTALGVEPAQAVFIDDFRVNIRAAKGAGMNTVHFQNAQQAMRDLDDMLFDSDRSHESDP
jgi:HAD superfamily hydrolase (TIGR01509 family)